MQSVVRLGATAALTLSGMTGVWQAFDAPAADVKVRAGGASSTSTHRAAPVELHQGESGGTAADVGAGTSSSVETASSAQPAAPDVRASSGARTSVDADDDGTLSASASGNRLADPCPAERPCPPSPQGSAGLNAQLQSSAGSDAGSAAIGGAATLALRVP